MKLCKVFLKPGLPAVRYMVRFPVPPLHTPPHGPQGKPPSGRLSGTACGRPLRPGLRPGRPCGPASHCTHPAASPPAPPKPALPHLPPGRSPPPSGRLGGLRPPRRLRRRGCAPRTNQLHAQTTPMHPPAAHPPPQGALPCGNGPDGLRPSRPLFPLKSPQSLANAAKIRIIKWYISYRKGEQKLWQIKRKW